MTAAACINGLTAVDHPNPLAAGTCYAPAHRHAHNDCIAIIAIDATSGKVGRGLSLPTFPEGWQGGSWTATRTANSDANDAHTAVEG